jgi:hypothetical protein
LVQELLELPDGFVPWDGERIPMVGVINAKPGYWVELSIKASRNVGVDDYRQSYDDNPSVNANVSLTYGYRVYTVGMKCSSYDFLTPAFDVAETLRRRLRSVTAKSEIQAANLALVRFHPTVDVPKPADTRVTSVSQLDVELAWMVTEVATDDTGGIIETVNTTGLVPAVPPLYPIT